MLMVARYIDYAVESVAAKYGFEVDGEYFHLMRATYRDGLLRQNLIRARHGGQIVRMVSSHCSTMARNRRGRLYSTQAQLTGRGELAED
jgi:hypothetical protein